MAENKGAKKLVAITKKAKQIRKDNPRIEWKTAIKRASSELSKKSVSGSNKNSSMEKQKSGSGTKKVVVVTGHHPVKRRKHRKVSGLHTKQKPLDMAILALGNILGGSIGAIVYNRVPGSNMVKGLVEAGVGFGGMLMIPQNKHLFFGIANGVTTGGGVNLLHSSGVMHGVDQMVSGLFDSLNGNEIEGLETEQRYIPGQTAGHKHLHESAQNAYVSALDPHSIDRWIYEGIPGQGGEDWRP